MLEPWGKVKSHYHEDVAVPDFADIELELNGDSLIISWKTSIGTFGNCVLPRSKAGLPSEIKSDSLSWDGFKRKISTPEGRRFIFRGQSGDWRLRTTYHRSGRADLSIFLNEDVKALHRSLSARTKHFFNLYSSQETGAFYSLAQHHGYPTPFLDWSFSPYVAAFFAFRGLGISHKQYSEDEMVKIFIFDHESWANDFSQSQNFLFSKLHLSVHEFIAIENERIIPQQGISTVTNIDDIEEYVLAQQKARNKTYLEIVNIPKDERRKVMHELSFMGITAGSLFPGLDGACEELKERFFYF